MTAISNAMGNERRSRGSGYEIQPTVFDEQSKNLPQSIVILGEANTANQAGLNTEKRRITSSAEAGQIYGYGSPIHQVARILKPINGEGIGGIPIYVMPQETDEAATATEIEWTITGTATKNMTHSVIVAGRENLDFKSYSYTVQKDDTPTIVAGKISNVISSVLGCPVTATVLAGVVTFVTKWKGKTSSELKVSFNTNNDSAGLTYAQTDETLGAGTVDLTSAFDQFGTDWHTCVINSYGSDTFDVLETFNGVPYLDVATGRYSAMLFKPFMAFSGSTLSDKDDLIAITDDADRVDQVTNVICPAPSSDGFSWEAAANMVYLFARTMQDTPELDVNGKSYPDMPVPLSGMIGDMSVYENRDLLIKAGCSTVILDKGVYKVQDLVTTYHPEGEDPLQFNYCRNLNLDWTIKYRYDFKELKLKDKVLIKDNQATDSLNAMKPKEWKAIVFDFIDELAVDALITEPEFSKARLLVEIDGTNPNRFNTNWPYKRTGYCRIQSTTVQAGF